MVSTELPLAPLFWIVEFTLLDAIDAIDWLYPFRSKFPLPVETDIRRRRQCIVVGQLDVLVDDRAANIVGGTTEGDLAITAGEVHGGGCR